MDTDRTPVTFGVLASGRSAVDQEVIATLAEQKSLQLGPATRHTPPLPAEMLVIESARPVLESNAKWSAVSPSDVAST